MSIHRVSENDNVAIDAIFKTLGRIAGKADIAVEAVHHTRKLGGAAATIEDARGASAESAAARNVEMLNRMTKDEAARAGIEDGEERSYFRSDSDRNLSPPSATEWFHLQVGRTWQWQRRPCRRSGLCRRRHPLEVAELI